MRPLLLTMSAFGSYAGNVEIDFEKLEKGVFLVTGDTGAGKTTIFDAITFCLYDVTSGGKRDGEMMRSHYASDELATFVQLRFLVGKDCYTVRRNPSYQRKSRRKNKDGAYVLTTETASVELFMPDGSAYKGKIKEINRKIVEIVGLDSNQFLQIAMIAQGDFLKLLHAPSKERKEIFGKIFRTGIYSRIQNELREEAKKLEEMLEQNQTECKKEFQELKYMPDSALREQLQMLESRQDLWETEGLAMLAALEQENKEHSEKFQKERLGLKTEIRKKEQFLELIRKKQEVELRIRKLEVWLGEQAKFLGMQEAEREKAQKQQEEKGAVLDEEIIRLMDLIPSYEELEKAEAELKKSQKSWMEWERLKGETEAELSGVKEQREQILKEQEVLSEAEKRIPEIDWAIQELSVREHALLSIQDLQKKLKKLETSLREKKAELEKNLGLYREKAAAYQELYTRFIEEQVGMIANRLKSGEPCPVCGSLSHPNPAPVSNLDISQEAVEKLRKEARILEEMLNTQRELFAGEKQLFQTEYDHLKAESRKVLGEETDWKEAAWKRIQKELIGCVEEKKQKTAQKKRYEAEKAVFAKNKEALLQLENRIKELEQLQAAHSEKREEARILYERLHSECQRQKALLPYPEASQAKKVLDERKRQKEMLKNALLAAENALARGREEFYNQSGALKTEKEELERLNVQQQQKAEEGISETLLEEMLRKEKRLEQEEQKLLHFLMSNAVSEEKLKKLLEEKKTLEKEYGVAGKLDKTANGKRRQAAGMDFTTYVQRRYFAGIIAEANKRLLKMTGGSFYLKCRDIKDLGMQGEVGLDLDVYSCVTDSVRDVRTLSGGESFMAALSMALGMAEIVQRTAGKVRLETMFIDEGFGSLDEESRQQAIRILNELAGENRLVGIISHVEELKEQIDRRIEIKKGRYGSEILMKI